MDHARSSVHPRAALAVPLVLTLLVGLVAIAAPAAAVGTFSDDDGNVHEDAIEAIASAGLAKGCNPPQNSLYCPDKSVTRGEMAAFLNRLLDLSPAKTNHFTDDDASVFEDDINAIAGAAITNGCNPPDNTEFCPDRTVTRGEMAAFLARALDLESTGGDYFADDAGSIFEEQINALARVGITRGCNPPADTDFCPDAPIKRDQMATFLWRALDIDSTGTTTTSKPPSTTSTSEPRSTSTTVPATGPFLAQDGIVAMEVESVPIASGWSRETTVDGFTGSAYYYRTGPHTTQTGEGTLTFEIVIEEPGQYAVSIRSRRDKTADEDVENGQRNDVFVKMNSDQWWKSTTHDAFGTWGWIDKKTIAPATFQPLVWDLGAGTHSLLISGRSQFIKIDRVHVYKVPDGLSLSQVQALNPSIGTPESPRVP
jgi:hypothetical protein